MLHPDSQSTKRSDVRRLALNRWTIQILGTAGLVTLALMRVDLQEVGAALERADYVWAGAAVGVLTLSKLLAAARWRLYLSEVGKPPLLGLMSAYVIGTFLSTLLPFRAGDFAKIQIVASRYGLPRAGLTSSVFVVEGVLDMVTLLSLLLLGLAFLDVSFVPAALLWPLVFLAGSAFAIAVLVSHLFPQELPVPRLPSFVPDSGEGWTARCLACVPGRARGSSPVQIAVKGFLASSHRVAHEGDHPVAVRHILRPRSSRQHVSRADCRAVRFHSIPRDLHEHRHLSGSGDRGAPRSGSAQVRGVCLCRYRAGAELPLGSAHGIDCPVESATLAATGGRNRPSSYGYA